MSKFGISLKHYWLSCKSIGPNPMNKMYLALPGKQADNDRLILPFIRLSHQLLDLVTSILFHMQRSIPLSFVALHGKKSDFHGKSPNFRIFMVCWQI